MDAVKVGKFFDDFLGSAAQKVAYDELENAKRSTFELLFSELTPEKKQSIKKGLTFNVYDSKGKKKESSFSKRGQEHSIDTHGSVKRGHGLREEDQQQVYAAMTELVELTRKAIDKIKALKRPDGRPVYDIANEDLPDAEREKMIKAFTTLIELEVFSPLVREGILPENFVLNDFSEVQKLLDNTFNAYRGSLKEAKEDKEMSAAKMEMNFHGAGSKLDSLKGLGGKASQLKDKFMNNVGLTESRMKKVKIGVEIGKLGYSVYKVQSNAQKWIPDENGKVKAVEVEDKFLNPEKYKGELSPERLKELGTSTDPDQLRMQLEHQKREGLLVNYVGGALNTLGLSPEDSKKLALGIEEALEILDTDPAFYTKASIEELYELVDKTIATIIQSYDIHTLRGKLDGVKNQVAVRDAADEAVEEIDAVVVAVLKKLVSPVAGECFGGMFLNELDVGALHESLGQNLDGLGAVGAIADALEAAFVKASPLPQDPVFKIFADAGKAAAAKYRETAPNKELEKNVKNPKVNPKTWFDPFIAAAGEAVAAGCTPQLIEQLKSPETVQKLAMKSVMPDEEEALEELQRSEEEIKEYERMLTLIDDGGISAAEERSIEKLIDQLNKDRQVLELVNTLGSTLDGVGGGAVGIANWASEGLTDVVAGQITGPLKAAKMIMQLAVNIKKAADRWALWYKFKRDLERSKKAVSSLSSTIQGFFNNKEDQIAFRTIEDALLAVQIAATIMGSVPEPYTMAIGKTMSLVAGAAQQALKVSEMIYTEVKLSQAWTITSSAMNNPGDRALGLQALRLNPTLGMHAIAWAGMEKSPPDPIARMFLNSCGLNENTLAVSGTEKKVRTYLETLLNEDRKMLDPSKINADWLPSKYAMNTKDWFIITSRAQTDASPKLRAGSEKAVLDALKKTDKYDKLDKWEAAAKTGDIPESELKGAEEAARALVEALKNFEALATDGTPHYEMAPVGDEYAKWASEFQTRVRKIADMNRGANDPDKAIKVLDMQIAVFENFFGPAIAPTDPPGSLKPVNVKKELVRSRGEVDVFKETRAFDDHDEIQSKLETVEELFGRVDVWLTMKGEAPTRMRPRRELVA